MDHDRKLDCFGLSCPMPLYMVSKEIKKMNPGEVLEVTATDEGIKEDMPAWCNTTGNEFLGVEEESDTIKVYVRKKEGK